MMEANGLRIGNKLLRPNGNIATVTHYIIQDIVEGNKTYQPIPLTEDWYAKLPSLDPDYRIEFMGEDKKPFIQVFIGLQDPKGKQYFVWRTLIESPYVHIWQNLHYYLTNGQELELKENEKSNQG